MSRDSPATSRAERVKALVLNDTRDTDQMRRCLEEAGVLSASPATDAAHEDERHTVWCRGGHEGRCRRGRLAGTEK